MKTAETDITNGLSAHEQRTLQCVVQHMIPPSMRFAVPGADDPLIFADILRSLDRDQAAVREALALVDAVAGGCLIDLDLPRQAQALAQFRTDHPGPCGAIESAASRCYYRDDRVLASLGMELRPPFPLGYEVEQGDFSLLDPVRARGRIYRDAP